MSLLDYFSHTTMGESALGVLPGEREVDKDKDNIFNLMFNDREEFVGFFMKNKDVEIRRAVLKTDKLRTWYCRFIEDVEEVWSELTDANFCYEYCFWVAPRREVYSNINCDRLILKYLQNIGKNILLSSRIKHDGTRYKACLAGHDYKATWSKITTERWAKAYVNNVKPRVELKDATGYTDAEWNKIVEKHVRRLNENRKNDGRNNSRRTWKTVRDMDPRM